MAGVAAVSATLRRVIFGGDHSRTRLARRSADGRSRQSLPDAGADRRDARRVLLAVSDHLVGVDVRYAYKGTQVKAGQQYYVLNFRVDNPNADKVSPGLGFDYMRVSFNGGPIHPPVDNTLPYGFDAGAKGVSGRVVFIGPAGLKSLTLDFLVQYGSGGSNYVVTL